MISVFNGRSRTLGGSKSEIYVQVSVEIRDYLHLFKGASLGVFLAIALHADENGRSHPGSKRLCQETGYNKNTVFNALKILREMTIEGHRVLCSIQRRRPDGTPFFDTNMYQIFPSEDEVRRFEVESENTCPNFWDTNSWDTKNADDKKNQSQSTTNSKLKPTTTTQAGANVQADAGDTSGLLLLKGVTEKDTELLALLGTVSDETFIAQVKAEYPAWEAPLQVVLADPKVRSEEKTAVGTLRNWLQGIGRPKGPKAGQAHYKPRIVTAPVGWTQNNRWSGDGKKGLFD